MTEQIGPIGGVQPFGTVEGPINLGGTTNPQANPAPTLSGGTGVPNNAVGANGDIYFRVDGGVGITIYQRRAGAWVATAA